VTPKGQIQEHSEAEAMNQSSQCSKDHLIQIEDNEFSKDTKEDTNMDPFQVEAKGNQV